MQTWQCCTQIVLLESTVGTPLTLSVLCMIFYPQLLFQLQERIARLAAFDLIGIDLCHERSGASLS